jgi:hypothetical protein
MLGCPISFPRVHLSLLLKSYNSVILLFGKKIPNIIKQNILLQVAKEAHAIRHIEGDETTWVPTLR